MGCSVPKPWEIQPNDAMLPPRSRRSTPRFPKDTMWWTPFVFENLKDKDSL